MPRALIIPLYDILLDKYQGFVIDKIAQPHLIESDIWDITTFQMPDMDTKKDAIFKSILLIPFFPYYMFLRLTAKYSDKADEKRRKFSLAFRRRYNRPIGRETTYGRHRRRKDAYPDAVYEDIPALYEYCKQKQAAVIIYSFTEPTPEQALKIENLIKDGDIAAFKYIPYLGELEPLLQQMNISIPDSGLVITDWTLRLEAEDLGFNTGLIDTESRLTAYFWN